MSQGRARRTMLACGLALMGFVACAVPAALAVDELDYGLQQHRLRKIILHGNETFSDKQLKSLLQIQEPNWLRPLSASRYRPDLLDAELQLLRRYYQQNGFQRVVVSLDSNSVASGQSGDILTIGIHEGPRTVIASVSFQGEAPVTDKELRRQLSHVEGSPMPADLNDLGGDIYNLRAVYRDRGYLLVEIVPSTEPVPATEPGQRAVALRYQITPGRHYKVGKIAIEGNRRTRTALIRRELRVKPGADFAWRSIEKSHQQLLETGLLRDVSFMPENVDTTTGTADLLVRVVERRPAFYELGAGVGSRERIRLLGSWGHNNLWGRGWRFLVRNKIYWTVEEIAGSGKPSRPEFNYRSDLLATLPHVGGSRFRLDTNFYVQKDTRGESALNLKTRGFSLGTQFRGGPRVLNTVALEIVESNPQLHPEAPDSLKEQFIRSGVRKSQTRSIVYTLFEEGRDDIFRPRHGSLATAQLELAGGQLQGDNSFVRSLGAWHVYRPTPVGGVLAMRVSVGAVVPYAGSSKRGADGVPYASRFFAGGASSVRGYLESSLGPQITDPAYLDSLRLASDVPLPDNPARGGNYLLLTNVEWRFPLPLLRRWKLGSVLFMDGGNVWQKWHDIRLVAFRLRSYPRPPEDPQATKLWDYRYSVGTGLRLDTPFGPFRIDVGIPLKRAPGEDKYLTHFSLGYPF